METRATEPWGGGKGRGHFPAGAAGGSQFDAAAKLAVPLCGYSIIWFASCLTGQSMVRTYAFNPSVQSHLDQSLMPLPALVLHSAVGGHHPRDPGGPLAIDHGERERQKEDRWPARTVGGMAQQQQNGTGTGTASTSSSAQSQLSIQEERTTLVSIRCVLINGQRFFQPVELGQQNGGGNSPIPWDQQQQNALISIAAIPAAGSQQANGRRGWEEQQREDQRRGRQKGTGGERTTQLAEQQQQRLPQFNHLLAGPGPSHLPSRPLGQLREEEQQTPPWAQGNPQPKSGQRGSREWQTANQPKGVNALHCSLGSSFNQWDNSWRAGENGGTGGGQQMMSEKERHGLELMRQIEENRERKMLERQREWEVEQKERLRDELWQQRVRMEMEQERRKEREKALLLEMKAAKMAAAQKLATEQTIREAEEKDERRRTDRARAEPAEGEQPAEVGLEWWERKDLRRAQQQQQREHERRATRGGAHSPALPALQRRQAQMSGSRQTSLGRSQSVGSRTGSSAAGRVGRPGQQARGYSPSVAASGSRMAGMSDTGGDSSSSRRARLEYDVR